MENLLTVRQLQEILQVDRITVYRMLADGRLTGLKVGGQWRFREADIQDLLSIHTPGGQPASVLPLPCVQAMQEVFAQALDVAVITTDMSGVPMTEWSNPCQFCNLILATPSGRQHCQTCWADLAHSSRQAHQIVRCHAGLGYVQRLIEVDGKPVGVIIAGQIAQTPAGELEQTLRHVAEACHVPLASLRLAYPTVHVLDERQTVKLLQIVHTMATAVCRIGHERQKLISRLDRIAAISSEELGTR